MSNRSVILNAIGCSGHEFKPFCRGVEGECYARISATPSTKHFHPSQTKTVLKCKYLSRLVLGHSAGTKSKPCSKMRPYRCAAHCLRILQYWEGRISESLPVYSPGSKRLVKHGSEYRICRSVLSSLRFLLQELSIGHPFAREIFVVYWTGQ